MKKLCFIFVVMLFNTTIFAQNPGDDYAIKHPEVEVKLWDSAKQDLDVGNVTYLTLYGDIFKIIRDHTISIGGKSVKGYEISFYDFNANRTQQQQALGFAKNVTPNRIIIDKSQNGKRFFITEDVLKSEATSDFKKRHSLARLDAFILPIKIRFKNKQPGGISELTQSINVGPAISFTNNYSGPFGKNSLNFIAALNATNISVDEKTVPGVVTGKTTLLGLSPTMGFNWQHQSLTFGIFTGVDILFGDAMDKWAYRKSPWIGLSIGTSITDLTTPKKSN